MDPSADNALVPLDSDSRLASSQLLVDAVQSASAKTTRHAVKPIQAACDQELSDLCDNDVQLARAASDYANGDVHSPLMIEALRHVHGCLASHSEALGPACVDTLMKAFLKNPPPLEGFDASDGRAEHPCPGGHKGHGHKHGGRHGKMRHHKDKDGNSDDVATSQLMYAINNNHGEGPDVARIGQGDHHGHGHRHHGGHPFVWMAVLPFFCVGVFVSVKRGIAFYKERRRMAPMASRAACEYVPLNAHET